MKPCTLGEESMALVEARGTEPQRQIVAYCPLHKPSCRYVLLVEDADGFIAHGGARFDYAGAAASAAELRA
jgi:hypothetical protein